MPVSDAETRQGVAVSRPQFPDRGYYLVGTATKEFVLHRIYEMGTDTLLLMGDGNLSQMEVCSRDAVLGKAVKIIRKGHEVDCSSRMERFLSLTWMRLRPFRRWLLVVCRFFLNGLDDKNDDDYETDE